MAERGGMPAAETSSSALAGPGKLDAEAWKTRALPKVASTRDHAERAWNTNSLGYRLGSDLISALSAGVLVAPIITMIDRGIMENSSGQDTLGGSIRGSLWRLLTQPHRFLFSKPFALVLSLYSGTYLTANAVDTLSSTVHSEAPSTTTAGATKFVATSASNLALCLYKDSKFTQMFSRRPLGHTKSVGLPTCALFTIRDCLTIFASFNLPTFIAPRLPIQWLGEQTQKSISSMSIAQFLAPAGIQIFSTPLHLLGLDLYNRKSAAWGERMEKVGKEWGKSTAARMGRIIPAFGVGGVVNRCVRENLMLRLER